MIEKRRGASPQSICRAEGNPRPEKPKTGTSKSVTWRCLAHLQKNLNGTFAGPLVLNGSQGADLTSINGFSASVCVKHMTILVESPQMWVWPQARTLPSSHRPALPTLLHPSSPPPGSFSDAPGEGDLGWCGGWGPRAGGVEGKVPPSGTWGQTDIWGTRSRA